MKRRAVCFLLCLCFCFCSVSLKSSAVDEDSPGYIFTKDDLLDLGYVFDDDTAFYLENKDPFDLGISLFRSKEKNYPDFDILKDIPWSSFPGYIQDIIYMSLDGLNTVREDEHGFIVPFVGVQVTTNGTVANVFVGTNVGLSYINNVAESFSIFSFLTYPEISQHSKLYRLRVDLINGNIVDWTEYKGEAFGDTGKLLRMLPWNTGNNTSVDDWYLYGANGVCYVYDRDNIGDIYDIGSVSAPSKNNLDSPEYVISNLSPVGFADGRFLPNQDVFYPHVYFQYFVPPSRESLQQQLQQEQNELIEEGNKTSKGIWETLKGIPEAIGEKIKGLFVPSDGFFDTYQQEFQTYFRERFGILYEIPELVISLLQKFVTFNPKEDNYSITFPEVKLPVLEDGEWREEKLIEAQEFSFDFINEAPFSLLYDAYVAFIWLVYILLLVNLIKYKANSVFKGG